MKIGVRAVQIAVAGFVVPYMAVYAPELMVQGDAGWAATLYVLGKAVLAVLLWGMAVIGHLRVRATVFERALALLAACLLVLAVPATDEAGFALALLVLAVHGWRARRPRAPAP